MDRLDRWFPSHPCWMQIQVHLELLLIPSGLEGLLHQCWWRYQAHLVHQLDQLHLLLPLDLLFQKRMSSLMLLFLLLHQHK